MKWFKLPPKEGATYWGGLFWATPMVFIFLDPYERHAGLVEWVLTSFAFLIFMLLYTAGLVSWSRKDILRRVCIATTLLALAFTAYRYSGVVFFVIVAAYAPFAVAGSILWSTVILVSLTLMLGIEWWLLYPPNFFPYIVGVESLIIGAGTTFVARQQIALSRTQKVAERERIARDLHDILGHTLSSIILKSELAGRLLDHDIERARAEIGEVETISRQALAEVREAIHGYHAGDLQTEFERGQCMLEASGISVEQRFEKVEIPAAQERILILALREAVTNIVRHAQAKHCRIYLQQVDGAYRLNVCDDGRGGINEQGFGIRGMRQRVESAGGSVAWNSEFGTKLTITLPITSAGN